MNLKCTLCLGVYLLCIDLWAGGTVVVTAKDEMCVGDSEQAIAKWTGPSGAKSWSWSVSGGTIINGDGTAIVNIIINTDLPAAKREILAVCTVVWDNGDDSTPVGEKEIRIYEFVREGEGLVSCSLEEENLFATNGPLIFTPTRVEEEGVYWYQYASSDKCDGRLKHDYVGAATGTIHILTQDLSGINNLDGGAFRAMRFTGFNDNENVFDVALAVESRKNMNSDTFEFGASVKDGISASVSVSINKGNGGIAQAHGAIDSKVTVSVDIESPEKVDLSGKFMFKLVVLDQASDYGHHRRYYEKWDVVMRVPNIPIQSDHFVGN
ncbi:MAG: hypothetical protein HRU15_03880 [Planctomycetes bacterium]|nr:hypothetical protein [Planctomycetota bacterium]